MISIAARDTTAAGDRRSRTTPSCPRSFSRTLAGALLATALMGCGSSSHVDMWIAKDPDAGADFVAPIREAGTDGSDDGPDSGAAGDNGNAGAGGGADTTAGSGGSGGVGGNATGGAAGA